LEKGLKVHDQILNDSEDRKGFKKDFLLEIFDQLLTRKAADTIDPHPVRATDSMAAGPAIRKGGILLRPDPVETVEKAIQRIRLHVVAPVVGFLILLRIKSKNFKFDEHQLPLSSAVLRFCSAAVLRCGGAAAASCGPAHRP
jgi:hypothetical protein